MKIEAITMANLHAANVIRYIMAVPEWYEGKRPFLLATNYINDVIYITEMPTPYDIWTAMSLELIRSKHHINIGFFHIKISPPMEECQGWRPPDWQKLLDDAIRHLDSTDFVTKSGKVIGKHTDIAHSQYVAAIHRDTDNYHIHLIVNRITMDDSLQDANKVRERGFLAAIKLAEEREWSYA